MPPTIEVKSVDDVIRRQREGTAHQVLAHFANRLPDVRLLCLFDDADWPAYRNAAGMEAARSEYVRRDGPQANWQEACAYIERLPDFDHLIYLRGSTCLHELGLAMAFAHELQHVVQCGDTPRLYRENSLADTTLQRLTMPEVEALGLRACDIPYEREARIVAKRVAEYLFGAENVRRYIAAKRDEFVTQQDAADWDCVLGLDSSDPYDLAAETKRFFPRLRSCRRALERELAGDPNFEGIDLDALLRGD